MASIVLNDLIAWFGHVVIISNIEDPHIIESRGYDGKFGIVHELPLNHFFQGINSFEELKNACYKNKPLTLLNRAKEPMLVVENFGFYTLIDE